MARPHALGAVLLFGVLGGAFAGAPTALHPLLTIVPLVLTAWFVNATAMNDLADEAVDRANLPGDRGRPLAAGAVDRRALVVLAVAAATAALVAAGTIGTAAVGVVAAGLALSAAYSFRLSGSGALAAALLPAGYVAVPYLVGALAVGRPVLAPLPGLWLVFLGRILLKDLRDEAGDRANGKRTFLVRHGRDATCSFSAAAWVVGTASVVLAVRAWAVGVPAALLLAAALVSLRRLRHAGDRYEDDVVTIALQCRGLAVVLLAHLTPGAPAWLPAAVAASLAAVAVRPATRLAGAQAAAA
jgi:4-hydroxybenzoate polyprenyltransferase